ncbi:hypothetical protein H4582DRAFT_2059044 [Lactarius indigo]|nr:hypothetical protein H4582DRAFT_2059044 [Lactarius indigo]
MVSSVSQSGAIVLSSPPAEGSNLTLAEVLISSTSCTLLGFDGLDTPKCIPARVFVFIVTQIDSDTIVRSPTNLLIRGFLRRLTGRGTPRGLRLRGNQHLTKHAVDPEHAAAQYGQFLAVSITSRSPRMQPRRSSTSTCVLPHTAASVSAKPPNLAIPTPGEAPSFDAVGEERLSQGYCGQGACAGRVDHVRSQAARVGTDGGAAENSTGCVCGTVVRGVRAAVAKVLAKRKRVHLLFTLCFLIFSH